MDYDRSKIGYENYHMNNLNANQFYHHKSLYPVKSSSSLTSASSSPSSSPLSSSSRSKIVTNQTDNSEVRNLILRLRPHDLPRIIANDETTFHKILLIIYFVFSMNLTGTITLMVYYLIQSIEHEMLLISSKDILFTFIGIFTTFIMKIIQWFVNMYSINDIKNSKIINKNYIIKKSLIIYIPCLITLWLAMCCIKNYRLKMLTDSNVINYDMSNRFELKYQKNTNHHNNNENDQQIDNNDKSNYMNLGNFQDLTIEKAMDEVHMKYKCCGINGIYDYHNWNLTIPDSCKILLKKNDNFNKIRGCHAYILSAIYDVTTQIYCIIFWLLIPTEGMFALLSIIAYYGKCEYLKNKSKENLQNVNFNYPFVLLYHLYLPNNYKY